MTVEAPNPRLAISQYRKRVAGYDRRTRPLERYRRAAVERLALSSGATVLDVACGTGNNFELLEHSIGPTGRLVGIDLSPHMLAEAEARVRQAGWGNVTLIESSMEDAPVTARADAALFSFTHDVLQSPRAVAGVVQALEPGARIAAVGAKWAAWWALPVNIGVWLASQPFITTFSGLRRPWAHLEPYIADLTVEPVALGGAYIAAGTLSAERPSVGAKSGPY